MMGVINECKHNFSRQALSEFGKIQKVPVGCDSAVINTADMSGCVSGRFYYCCISGLRPLLQEPSLILALEFAVGCLALRVQRAVGWWLCRVLPHFIIHGTICF
jgi:hypothetical protein